jgi:hypothetical protein
VPLAPARLQPIAWPLRPSAAARIHAPDLALPDSPRGRVPTSPRGPPVSFRHTV